MKVFSNEINTLQQHNITYQANIAYRNGDPYIVSSELNNPHIVFSLASSKFVKDKKYYKTWWGEIAGAYPTFYQTTPNVITTDILEENIPNYFMLNGQDWGKDHSWCVFNLNKEYFYYLRNPKISQAFTRPSVRNRMWSDGENEYYSYYEEEDDITGLEVKEHYVLDKSIETWIPKTWNGFDKFSGQNIWSFKGKIYCSDGTSQQYILNKTTSTWELKSWKGNNIPAYGGNVWIDEENGKAYYLAGNSNSDHLVLENDEETWSVKDWGAIKPSDTHGVWSYNGNYYSDYIDDSTESRERVPIVLDKSTSTWSRKNWEGLVSWAGSTITPTANCIWKVKDKCYLSTLFGDNYMLEEDQTTWVKKVWNGLPFRRSTDNMPIINPGNNLPYISAEDIWSYNDNTYSSCGTIQYILDESTSTWVPKVWPATYQDGYTYEKVPYEFMYRKAFDYDTVKEWQGLDYVYDIKIVSGITNYEYLVNLMHSYKLDQKTDGFMIELDKNSYTFGWIDNQWLFWDSASTSEVDGRVPSFEILASFAKSNVILTYLEGEAKDYLEQAKKATIKEPITVIDNVDYILHPTAFNVTSIVKGRVCDGHKR